MVKDILNFSNYSVIKRIGTGARSAIYLANDEIDKVQIALKRVVYERPEDSRVFEQMENEYKTARQIDHPYIRKCYKLRKIRKFLKTTEVLLSMEMFEDLPSKGLNVDIENDFEPTYDIMAGKKRTLNSLKASAKKCDKLYLATDLDREGEAIAWHLSQVLGIDEENTYRVVFNAITKNAIQKAFSEPGKLDMAKVMAQQARRILDRIVGYQISPLLWKKVARGLSAGRVQSVAV